LTNAARSVLLFPPYGWAPCGLTPQAAIDQALEVVDRTNSMEKAEMALVEGWNADPWHLRFSETRLRGIGFADEGLAEVCTERAALVAKALTHHRSGAYEASVPIVMFQIDGLVRDLTAGRNGFFSDLGARTHLRDTTTIAGLDEGLAALQSYFGRPQATSGSTGGISRHGVVHGRELGYDTLINSTKCFVLLLAVIEWAGSRIEQRPGAHQDQ